MSVVPAGGGAALTAPCGTREGPGQRPQPHREAAVFMQPLAGTTAELGQQGHCSFQLPRGLGVPGHLWVGALGTLPPCLTSEGFITLRPRALL